MFFKNRNRNFKMFFLGFASALFFLPIFLYAGGGRDSLRGREIIIGNFWGDWDVESAKPEDEIGERTLEMRKNIQRDHGVVIKQRQIADWGSMLETVITSIMAGRPAAQVFDVMADWAMAMHRQGLLAAVSDSKAVNLKNTVSIPMQRTSYSQMMGDAFTFNGKQYAFRVGGGGGGHVTSVFFNKRLYREAGLDPELPYNMQRDGSWTWDNFLDISKRLTRDRNNTGRVNTWAMPEDYKDHILEGFVYSNGAEFVVKDAQGRFFNASGSQEFIQAFNYVRRLRTEGIMMPAPDNPQGDWPTANFLDGNVAMIIDQDWRISTFANMSDDWGIVLVPKGPGVRDYRHPDDETVMVISSTYRGEDLDAILLAFDLWNRPVADDWRAGLWNQFRDRRAIDETLAMSRGPRAGTYGAYRNNLMVPGLNIGDIAWNMWWWGDDPAQLIESVSPNWNALINEANNMR